MTTARALALGLAHIAIGAVIAIAGCDTLKARREASAAAALYKEGDLKAAAERYARAARLDPNIATIHLNLGFAWLSMFQAAPKGPDGATYGARAVAEFRTYHDLRPDDPRGRNYLIQTFVDTRRYDDAVAFFKPEVERAAPSLEAIGILGQIAAKVGRFSDALGWYQKRIDVAPRDPDGFVGMGVIVWDHLHNHAEVTGAERTALADRGIAALTRATELSPAPPEPYVYVNLVFRERAAAFVCPAADGGVLPAVAPGAPPSDAAECQKRRDADLAQADRWLRIALDKIRAKSGAPAPPDAGGR